MTINGIKWKIEYADLEKGVLGCTNYVNLTIQIKRMPDKNNEHRTLLHEIIHAYTFSYGFVYIKTIDKETLCDFIANNFENISKLYEQAKKELK